MEEPRNPTTVQSVPPEVGGVTPDSNPPLRIMVEGQLLVLAVGAERVNGRVVMAERRRGKCILMIGRV